MQKDLKQLKPPGLKPIKQVELYTKWRPLLPKEVQDMTCPRPSEEVLNLIKAERKMKYQKCQSLKKENSNIPNKAKKKKTTTSTGKK